MKCRKSMMLVIWVSVFWFGFIANIDAVPVMPQNLTTESNSTDDMMDWMEADFYAIAGWNETEEEEVASFAAFDVTGGRPGSASKTHSCKSIRRVPGDLRNSRHMYPRGLTQFYQRYTEAYGLPVVGSARVTDDALRRACYTVRFLFADREDLRQSYYKKYGRFALIAADEYTTQIPEFSDLPPSWNARARGFGATTQRPVSLGAEENALCWRNRDKWREQDIVMHEFAHGLHLLGAYYAIPGYHRRLQSLYNSARASGKWANTYSLSTEMEYLAEGVQAYFHVQRYANPPDGINNHVNTRAKLRSYDPGLYNIIKELFPCNNEYIKRCDQNREEELGQVLKMDCDAGNDTDDGGSDGGGDNGGGDADCADKNPSCGYWSRNRECGKNPAYMLVNCRKSCNKCGSAACRDSNTNCAFWGSIGECNKNSAYMLKNCKKSCKAC